MTVDPRHLNALAQRCWKLHDQTRDIVAVLATPSLISGPETAGRMLRRLQIGAVDMVLLHCMAWLAKVAEGTQSDGRVGIAFNSYPRPVRAVSPVDFREIDDAANAVTEETQQLVRDMARLQGSLAGVGNVGLDCEAMAE